MEYSNRTVPATKGYGLRKWRRIERDLSQDGSVSADSAQIVKRRFSDAEPSETLEEQKMKSKAKVDGDDSAGSFQSRNAEIHPELERFASSIFSIGTEDRSSSMQQFQRQRVGRIDSNKKNGDETIVEKKKSRSSVESDLSSSAAVGRLSNFDEAKTEGKIHLEENASENPRSASDPLLESVVFLKEAQEALEKEIESFGVNVEELEDNDSQFEGVEDTHLPKMLDEGTHQLFLQEERQVMEAELESLLEKRMETEIEFLLLSRCTESWKILAEDHIALFNGQRSLAGNYEEMVQKLRETEKKSVELERTGKLEAEVMEAEIEFLLGKKMETEIEFFILSRTTKNWEIITEDQIALFNKQWSLAGDCEKTMLKLRDSKEKAIDLKEEDMEAELEVLLEKKMQTEIEVLILSSTTESCKILAEDHVALIKDQWSLAGDCEKMMLKVRDAEKKAIELKEKTDKLEEHCEELVRAERVLRLKIKVCMFSLCCFLQLLLLCISLLMFIMQLSHPLHCVVPT